MSPTGSGPGRAAGKIYSRLALHEEERGGGGAFPDNVGFLVSLPGRKSFSPGAPLVFRRGDTADAAPAVPGWTLSVDALFR